MDTATTNGTSQATKICVLGASLDVGNRGVRALALSVVALFLRADCRAVFSFNYGNAVGGARKLSVAGKEVEVRVHNCRLSPRSAPAEHILVILILALLYRLGLRWPARRNAWLRSILDADVIGEIRGGDSFSDIYGLRKFLVGILPVFSVWLVRRPYVLLPQTYGPFRSGIARRSASFILRGAAVIMTRDASCQTLVERLSGRRADFCPDVAFTLEATRPAAVRLSPLNASLDDNEYVIGMNVSGLLYMGGYTKRNMFKLVADYRLLVDAVLGHVLTTTTSRILLVPHVIAESEEEACSAIMASVGARYPDRMVALSGEYSETEIKWVIGRTQVFIGSRMHACIAAMSQCIPTIGFAYSDKFRGVFQSAGVDEWIVDLRTADVNDVCSQIVSLIARRDEQRKILRSRMPLVQQEIMRAFSDVISRMRLEEALR